MRPWRPIRTRRVACGCTVVGALLALAACSDGRTGRDGTPAATSTPTAVTAYPPAPTVPNAATPEATAAFEAITEEFGRLGTISLAGVNQLVASGDARHAWLLSDLLRFAADPLELETLRAGFAELTGFDPAHDPRFERSPWTTLTNYLITWDLPAPPDYQRLKGDLYTLIEPAWEPFFADPDAAFEWRWLSWGGVLIDDRPLGEDEPCRRGCIPALDDPALTDAAGGAWYPEEAEVFGVAVGGEYVALPKRIMEVHEMVNLTLGGRRLGIPYCTLCGAAQAYLTDDVLTDGRSLVLRTSGLLSRSNKVMYDLVTQSAFDTFKGVAVSGPLQGTELTLVTTEVATWGEWKRAHPDTRIIAADGGIGRTYPEDPLRGRDDDGPIFPTGAVDPRLGAHDPVVGVIAPDGVPLAFPVAPTRAALAAGRTVEVHGVRLETDGAGLRARAGDGGELPAHQAFWFAWSQFHPDTQLWAP